MTARSQLMPALGEVPCSQYQSENMTCQEQTFDLSWEGLLVMEMMISHVNRVPWVSALAINSSAKVQVDLVDQVVQAVSHFATRTDRSVLALLAFLRFVLSI